MALLSKQFWADATERMVKTVAQAAIGVLGAGATGVLDVNWGNLISVSLMAGLVSVLTSVASAGVTARDSASLVEK